MPAPRTLGKRHSLTPHPFHPLAPPPGPGPAPATPALTARRRTCCGPCSSPASRWVGGPYVPYPPACLGALLACERRSVASPHARLLRLPNLRAPPSIPCLRVRSATLLPRCSAASPRASRCTCTRSTALAAWPPWPACCTRCGRYREGWRRSCRRRRRRRQQQQQQQCGRGARSSCAGVAGHCWPVAQPPCEPAALPPPLSLPPTPPPHPTHTGGPERDASQGAHLRLLPLLGPHLLRHGRARRPARQVRVCLAVVGLCAGGLAGRPALGRRLQAALPAAVAHPLPPTPAHPAWRRARVEAACREIGGQLVEAGQEARSSSLGSHRFSFSFLARNWNSAWGERARWAQSAWRWGGVGGQLCPSWAGCVGALGHCAWLLPRPGTRDSCLNPRWPHLLLNPAAGGSPGQSSCGSV